MSPKGVYEREPLEDRFWRNVDVRGPDDCWPWLGAKRGGYGIVQDNYKQMGAHRVAYELTKGKIPQGMFVCHTCDNPQCVNPAHLFLGTAKDNTLDAAKKSRLAYGKRNAAAKLTEDQVWAIRKSTLSQRKLAKLFGVSQANIWFIKNNKTWRHVGGEK